MGRENGLNICCHFNLKQIMFNISVRGCNMASSENFLEAENSTTTSYRKKYSKSYHGNLL